MKGKRILDEVRFLIHDPSYTRFHEINRAYRKICKLTDFNWLRKEDETAVAFSADTSTYTIPMSNIRVLQDVYVKGGNDARWKQLEETTPRLFEIKVRESQDLNASDNTSKPVYYKLEGGPDYILSISPTPDQAYSVRLNYIQTTPEIVIDSEVNIPGNYFDTVSMLASGYILQHSSDERLRGEGSQFVSEAFSEFDNLVRDSHHNRTRDIDRTPRAWMK